MAFTIRLLTRNELTAGQRLERLAEVLHDWTRAVHHVFKGWKRTSSGMEVDHDIILAGTYDGSHLVMRGSHLWVDATGDLRIKSSSPTGDLDGTIVGLQS